MKSQGRHFGQLPIIKKVLTKTAQAAGTKTELSLEDIPSKVGDLPFVVLGLFVRFPTAAVTLTGSKIFDGVSMAQMLGTVSLRYGHGSPAAKSTGSRFMFQSLDGYTLAQALAFETGCPIACGPGRSFLNPSGAVSAADVTESTAEALTRFTLGGHRGEGDWMQFLGPFAAADSTSTAAYSDRPCFYLPIGEKAGDKRGRYAIPANWLNGQKAGRCAPQDAGALEITLPSTTDNLAITWTVADGFEVYALGFAADPGKIPCPRPLVIEVLEPGQNANQVNVPAGSISFLGFVKALSSGAMAAHSYTTAHVEIDGEPVTHDDCAELLRAISLSHGNREFGFAAADAAFNSAAAAGRRLNAGVPLYMHRGSPLHALGSDRDGAVKVKIKTSGESSHRVLCIRRAMQDDTLRQAAEEYARGILGDQCGGAAQVKYEAAAANGNTILSPAMAAVLPGQIRAKALEKIPG